jgi:hypothetical protein
MMPATQRIPRPTKTATMIRMIFSALGPPFTGAATATGCAYVEVIGAFEAGGT